MAEADDFEVDPNSLGLDPTRLDDLRIVMDLERLGELIAHVATTFAVIREVEPPDVNSEEMRALALSGWKHVCRMHDRAEFAASVVSDLENLDSITQDDVTQDVPEHRSEFGL